MNELMHKNWKKMFRSQEYLIFVLMNLKLQNCHHTHYCILELAFSLISLEP